MNVGSTLTASIAPTDDKDQPAAGLGKVAFDAVPPGRWAVAQAQDGLSAVYTALTPSTGCVAVVTAVTVDGVTLGEKAQLPDVIAQPNPPTRLHLALA